MSRVTRLNSPFMLGFEHFEQTLDRISKAAGDGYPPYNIEQTGQDGLRITLAVAGFTMNDLSVEVADNQLVIRGRHNEDDGDRVFLHRGIASRQFQRSFVLADGIEVGGASLDNGLLSIDLHRPKPETVVRTIKIDGPGGRNAGTPSAETIDVEGTANDGDRG